MHSFKQFFFFISHIFYFQSASPGALGEENLNVQRGGESSHKVVKESQDPPGAR